MWFFGHVAALAPEQFMEHASKADASWEIRARLAQATIMAPIMVRRATWVNRAFVTAALTFTFVALAVADYVRLVAGSI